MDDFLKPLKDMVDAMPVPIKAGMLAFVLRVLRLAYARKEKRWQRRVLEGSICSCLTVGIGYGLAGIGMNELLSFAVAAYAGHYGADKTAETASNKLRLEDKDEDNKPS